MNALLRISSFFDGEKDKDIPPIDAFRMPIHPLIDIPDDELLNPLTRDWVQLPNADDNLAKLRSNIRMLEAERKRRAEKQMAIASLSKYVYLSTMETIHEDDFFFIESGHHPRQPEPEDVVYHLRVIETKRRVQVRPPIYFSLEYEYWCECSCGQRWVVSCQDDIGRCPMVEENGFHLRVEDEIEQK